MLSLRGFCLTGLSSAVMQMHPETAVSRPCGEPPAEVDWLPQRRWILVSIFFYLLKTQESSCRHPSAALESLVSETCLLSQPLTFSDWDTQKGIVALSWFFSSLVISGSILKWGCWGIPVIFHSGQYQWTLRACFSMKAKSFTRKSNVNVFLFVQELKWEDWGFGSALDAFKAWQGHINQARGTRLWSQH